MNNELAFYEFDDAMTVAAILLRNDYVCMFSMEDELTILNFEWAENCDRNGIVFRNANDFEYEQDKICNDCMKDREEVCANCRSNSEKEFSSFHNGEVGDCCND